MASTPQPAQTSAPAMPPEAILMQMLFGKMVSFTISAVAQLEVADHLTDEPRAVDEIAAATGTHAPSLYRVLRVLASIGVFTESPDQCFSLTPVGHLLRKDDPKSLRNMAIMFTDPWLIQSYLQIPHCIRTGGDGVTAAYGKHIFDLFKELPEQAANFHRAMTDFSRMGSVALLQVADFTRFRRLADVGGGHGLILARILEKFPSLNGVLFDLPEVAAGIPESGNLATVQNRITVETGSFFEQVPAGCDAYLMKHIIHDWDDGSCRRILSLMRDQLAVTAPVDGRVFLFEMVVPDSPEPCPAKMLDIEMLIATSGGKERTHDEFATLFASAGLQLVSITQSPSPLCLIEAKVAG